jgi:hypothetical protein
MKDEKLERWLDLETRVVEEEDDPRKFMELTGEIDALLAAKQLLLDSSPAPSKPNPEEISELLSKYGKPLKSA